MPGMSFSSGLERSGLSIMGLGAPLSAPEDARLDPERRKLKAVAREFEAVMVGQLLAAMRSATFGGDPLDKGPAARMYRDMMDQQLSREMARRGGISLADTLFRELSRTLPAADPARPGEPVQPGELVPPGLAPYRRQGLD